MPAITATTMDAQGISTRTVAAEVIWGGVPKCVVTGANADFVSGIGGWLAGSADTLVTHVAGAMQIARVGGVAAVGAHLAVSMIGGVQYTMTATLVSTELLGNVFVAAYSGSTQIAASAQRSTAGQMSVTFVAPESDSITLRVLLAEGATVAVVDNVACCPG